MLSWSPAAFYLEAQKHRGNEGKKKEGGRRGEPTEGRGSGMNDYGEPETRAQHHLIKSDR
jgi:hypothetical protein